MFVTRAWNQDRNSSNSKAYQEMEVVMRKVGVVKGKSNANDNGFLYFSRPKCCDAGDQ